MERATEIPYELYELLRETARRQHTIYYAEAALVAGVDTENPHFAAVLGRVLDEINHIEAGFGRPLLSAVVISRDSGMPGTGFFTCARRLKMHSGRDDFGYWVAELIRVHEHWLRR